MGVVPIFPIFKYIKIDDKEQITGEEFYAARCAVLHTYGVELQMTKSKKIRKIGYVVGGYPRVRYSPGIAKDVLLLDILALARAFYQGLDQFIIDIAADLSKKVIIEERSQKLLTIYSLKK
jgi:hypothetical protein